MYCNRVKNQLLLYVDNDLSPTQRQAIQSHLASCSDCTEHLNQLMKVWGSPSVIENVDPSPWLWSQIVSRLTVTKSFQGYFAGFRDWVSVHAVPVVATTIIMIGVLTGIYLGTLPQDTSAGGSASIVLMNARTDFIKTSHLDAFDDLAPASIGGAYIALEANQP